MSRRAAVPCAARGPQGAASTAGPLLQRKCVCGAVSPARGGRCEACDARRALPLQAKLAVSSPGDRFEREADRIADEVIRTTRAGPTVQPAPTATPLAQRAAEQEPEEDEEEVVQAKRAGASPRSPVTGSDLQSLGDGRPLPPRVRAFFEARLGHDISRVRIHTDAAAHDTARRLHARAFTHREHVYFASGQYAPASLEGRRLIAHELVHTQQQRPGIARSVQPASAAAAPATPAPATCGPSNCACDAGAADELEKTRVKAMEVIGVATRELAGLDFSARTGRRARARRRFKRVFGRSFGVKTFTAANAAVVEQRLTAAKGFLGGLKPNQLLCDEKNITLTCQSGSLAYYNPAPPRIVFCTGGDIGQGIARARLDPTRRAAEEEKKHRAEESGTEMLEGITTDQPSTDAPDAPPPAPGAAPPAPGAAPPAQGAATGADAIASAFPAATGKRPGFGEYERAFKEMKLAAKVDLTATMIHEAVHHAIQPGIVDIYSMHSLFKSIGGRGATAKELGPAAIENPDSYARFALDLVRGRESLDPATGTMREILPEAERVLEVMDKPSAQTTEIGPAVARRKIRLAVDLAKQAMRETEVGLRLAQSGGASSRPEPAELLKLLAKSRAVGPGTPSDQALQDMEIAIGALVSQFDVKTISVRRRQANPPDPAEIELLVSSGLDFRKLGRLEQVRSLLEQVLAGDPVVAGLTDVVIAFSQQYGVLKGFV